MELTSKLVNGKTRFAFLECQSIRCGPQQVACHLRQSMKVSQPVVVRHIENDSKFSNATQEVVGIRRRECRNDICELANAIVQNDSISSKVQTV